MLFSQNLFDNSSRISLTQKKSEKDIFTASFKTDLGEYELNLSLKHDKIIITCESDIEFLSIYSYSKEFTFEELKKLSNTFKTCENIEQSFATFKNILKGICFKINNNDYKSELSIKFSDDDSLTMKIKIPLIYEEYENIEINFEKKEKKDVFEQFKILRKKYLKVKDIISLHSCSRNYYNNDESLMTSIKNIEKESKNSLFTFSS